MPNGLEDPYNRFLSYYGQYLDAKEANHPNKIWLLAIQCRSQLQKMADVSKEAETCQKIFEAFVGKEKAAQIYRELCDDSRSYPSS
jgi:hypothetical protein